MLLHLEGRTNKSGQQRERLFGKNTQKDGRAMRAGSTNMLIKKLSVASWNTTALFGLYKPEKEEALRKRASLTKRLISKHTVAMFQEVHGGKDNVEAFILKHFGGQEGHRAWSSSTERAAKGGIMTVVRKSFCDLFDFCHWHIVVLGRIAFSRMRGP